MSISLLLEMASSSDPERTRRRLRGRPADNAAAQRPRRWRRRRHREFGRVARRLRRYRRRDAAAADLRVGAGRADVHADQLPAVRRRHQGADRATARSAGGRRRSLPRRWSAGRPGGQAGHRVRRLSGAARDAEPAVEFADPGLSRHRAVHVGHHVAAQSRRAHAQQPDQLRHRHSRIRVGRADRRRADLRAAVPHRRGQRGPVESLRRPQDGLPARFRRRGVGAADRRRARHQRDGGADHAGPHRHRAGGRPPSSCRRCATWPTADRKVAAAAGAQGARTAAGRRLRQRLRPDRDQLDDRRADPRRPP